MESVPSELINICTGKILDGEIENSLVNFFKSSQERVLNLLNNPTGKSFWTPIKRNKLLTFKDAKVKTKSTICKKKFIGSESMFRRIICAVRFQELDLSNILTHELTLVPASLFNEDGSIRKTAKSDFAKKIESFTQNMIECPAVDSIIIDGMVSVQELVAASFITFSDLAEIFVIKILREGRKHKAKRIHLVFDTYNTNSLKNAERKRRGDFTVDFKVSGARKVPKFKEFIKSSSNKQSLLNYLTNYFLEKGPSLLDNEEEIIIAGGFKNTESCFLITKNGKPQNLERLNSNQEEADTRIILHVLNDLPTYNAILVKSVDTDILILLIYYYCIIPEMNGHNVFMQLGHSKNTHFVNVSEIVANIGQKVCIKLLAAHCLTGCDTTNALYKIGKKTAFDVLYKHVDNLEDLERLPELSEENAVNVSQQYILLLYKNNMPEIRNLNELRYRLTQSTNRSASELPPTDDAFKQHLKR